MTGDWVLIASCGCPEGVCLAEAYPDEMDAWTAFYDTFKEALKAKVAGWRLELIPHQRWCEEFLPKYGKCQHVPGQVTP